jgi:hypothetical protein
VDKFPRAFGGAVVEGLAIHRDARRVIQRLGQVKHRVLFLQRIDRAIQALQQHFTGAVQPRVAGQSAGDERQRLAAQHLLDQRRLHVNHPVFETFLAAGPAVMHFIGMDHHGPPRQAVCHAAAIVKALHAEQGAADGVSVVAMRVEAKPGKIRLDTLQPTGVGRAVQPVERGFDHGVSRRSGRKYVTPV